ncbi:MAG: TVP38/TMEM64 family protein [Caldilinea sp. CFX5]|nr:TVP38/TMEM64 family protein [Caldilinea sp. CFX5]
MMSVYEETPTRKDWWRLHGQKVVALFIWALLLGGYSFYYQRQGLTLESSLQQLLALFATPYGPLLYLASFLLRPLIFFSVGILCIMGGIIFGVGGAGHLLLALGYTVIGVMASALISFGIGRFFGHGLIGQADAETDHLVQRYANRLRRNGFLTVLTMRLILLPFDIVNYLAALVAVDWKAFTLGTAIGALPSTIAFVTFGAAIDLSQVAAGKMPTLNGKLIILAVALFGVSVLISRWYKRDDTA